MSRERTPTERSKDWHRRLIAERLAVRFPGVARRMVASIGRVWQVLPRGSRLRRRLAEFGVRRSYAAFNRRDLDMLAVLLHPDCTIDMSHVPDWVEESIYRGQEGLRRHIRDWDDLWGEIEYLPRAITDLGTEILVDSEMRTVGEVSGIALERTFAQVAESRDGLTWRIANYWDRAEALEAVGLRE